MSSRINQHVLKPVVDKQLNISQKGTHLASCELNPLFTTTRYLRDAAILDEHPMKSLQKYKKKFFECGRCHRKNFGTNKSRRVFLTQDFCKLGKLSRLVRCQ